MHSLWCTELYRLSIANMVCKYFFFYKNKNKANKD
jgi:hypothetical protein